MGIHMHLAFTVEAKTRRQVGTDPRRRQLTLACVLMLPGLYGSSCGLLSSFPFPGSCVCVGNLDKMPEKNIRFPGVRILGGCSCQREYWESNSGYLEEHQVLLTAQPPPQLPTFLNMGSNYVTLATQNSLCRAV